MSKKNIFIVLFSLLFASGSLVPFVDVLSVEYLSQHEEKTETLLKLMSKRLMLMHEVAKWKWNRQMPIEDLQREHELIQKFSAQATQVRVDPQLAGQFLQAQIDSAKAMQRKDFMMWKDLGINQFEEVLDLNSVLRPQLDLLTRELLEAFAEVVVLDIDFQFINHQAERWLTGEGIDHSVRELALNPWLYQHNGN